MACLIVDGGTSTITSDSAAECTGYVLLTASDYAQLQINSLSFFDPDIFKSLTIYLLLTFISGYVLGVIARKLSR